MPLEWKLLKLSKIIDPDEGGDVRNAGDGEKQQKSKNQDSDSYDGKDTESEAGESEKCKTPTWKSNRIGRRVALF